MASIPNINLPNGKLIPQIGLGTWKSQPGEVEEAVKNAIDVGYRHIDCAFAYGNEDEIGNAISQKISEGIIKREDLFITSKVWNTYHSNAKAKECVSLILGKLKTPYIDLCLIHWPMGYAEGTGQMIPKDEQGNRLPSDVDYMETWKAMEELVGDDKIKSLGLSNFNSEQIDRVIKEGTVPPAINQVECHPYLNQTKLIEFCKSRNIILTAYSPLGSKDRPPHMRKDDEPVLLEDPQLVPIAERYGKSVAQILLKFQIQRGAVIIPKSVNKKRLVENIELFDFTLSDDDMKVIEGFNINYRYCVMEWDCDHKYYPFNIEF